MKSVNTILTLAFLFLNLSLFSQSIDSKIYESAKSLDVKSFHEFHDGFAVVEKGDAYAVIDAKGNFLIPYNKYRLILDMYNGYFVAYPMESTHQIFLLDLAGNKVFTGESDFTRTSKKGLWYLAYGTETFKNLPIFYYANTKKTYPVQRDFIFMTSSKQDEDPFLEFYNDLCLFTANSDGMHKIGYIHYDGAVKIPATFIDGRSFSEGLAAVAGNNEYGEQKWGFIDVFGKLVIPYTFSFPPGRFFHSLAYIKSKPNSGFSCGFIDPSGRERFRFKYDPKNESFESGYLFFNDPNKYGGKMYRFDTAGNEFVMPLSGTFNNQSYTWKSYDMSHIQDGVIKIMGSYINGDLGYGLADINGSLILPPIFHSISFIDPKSNLAMGSVLTAEHELIKGYINKEGIFVIKQAKESPF